MEQFRPAPPETSALSDSKHKTALVLKPELAADPLWQAFTPQAAQTTQRGQQTALAFLAPPTPRRNARYLNGDILIRWGGNLLGSVEQRHGVEPADLSPERLAEHYGWITGFRATLRSLGGAAAKRCSRRAVAHPGPVSRLSPGTGATASNDTSPAPSRIS